MDDVLNRLRSELAGRYEIEQRVGGNPSTNQDVNYAVRVTAVWMAASGSGVETGQADLLQWIDGWLQRKESG